LIDLWGRLAGDEEPPRLISLPLDKQASPFNNFEAFSYKI
jgi:hypothetical protein